MYDPAPMDYSHIALGELERLVEPLAFNNHEVWARQRIAMLSTAAFFVLGLIGMSFVNEKRGIEAARSWHEEHA